MRRFIRPKDMEPTQTLMNYAGYHYHCVTNGRACYHRRIWEVRFPRFHAYVTRQEDGLMVELHIDQTNPGGKSNHDKDWAYSGGRVEEEMEHLVNTIERGHRIGHVNRPEHPSQIPSSKPKKTRSLFDVLFR
jgi:hypothetical protein